MVKPSNKGHPSFMKPVYIRSHTCATTSVGNPEKDNISPECTEVTSMETATPPNLLGLMHRHLKRAKTPNAAIQR